MNTTTMMQSYCEGIRGFKELTQGDIGLIRMLEKEVGIKGKPLGFASTRDFLLLERFDYESLSTLIETYNEITSKDLKMNGLTKNILQGLCEKIIKNFVPDNAIKNICTHYSGLASLHGKELGMEMIKSEIMDKKNSNTVRYCMSL